MEKMVPTETLTSMLDEPSRGPSAPRILRVHSLQRRQSHLLLQRQCPQRYRVLSVRLSVFISEQVEFLLNLALHVLSTAGTQDINQSCFVDIAMDNLGAQFYCRQQSSELTGSMRKLVLLSTINSPNVFIKLSLQCLWSKATATILTNNLNVALR